MCIARFKFVPETVLHGPQPLPTPTHPRLTISNRPSAAREMRSIASSIVGLTLAVNLGWVGHWDGGCAGHNRGAAWPDPTTPPQG